MIKARTLEQHLKLQATTLEDGMLKQADDLKLSV